MPRITVDFQFTDEELAAVNVLRGVVPLDDFLRDAAQLGLCDFKDDANRQQKDGLYQSMSAKTRGYQQARTNAMIEAPSANDAPKQRQLLEP